MDNEFLAESPVNDQGGVDTGFFSDPAPYEGMGAVDTNTQFENPYADVAPQVAERGTSNEDPFAAQMDHEMSKRSWMASSAPQFFDWEANNTDRYINSEYYKELGFNPHRDNETLYGNRQTFGDTMQQAFAGSGSLAWNTFKDGWAGWGRLVDMIYHWDASRLMGTPESMEELSREQDRIMNKYAIFRTPESQDSIFSRQFLGDLIQQSGFALGTMAQFAAEELITAGAATLFRPAMTAMKIGSAAKWAKLGEAMADMKRLDDLPWKTQTAGRLYAGLQKASAVTKYIPLAGAVVDSGLDIMKAAKGGASGLELAGMTFNGFRRTIAEANMAFTESRMEAAGTYAELKNKLYADASLKGEVTTDDMQQIEKYAQAAAWSNFKINASVISVMNRFEFDNLFRTFGADKRAVRGMAEAGESAAKDMIDPKFIQKVTGAAKKDVLDASGKVTVKAGEEFTQVYEKGALGGFGNFKKVASDFGRKQAAWEATKSAGQLFKWEVGEGLQELIQEGSNIGIQHYYEDLYMHTKGDKGYDDYVDKAIEELSNANGLKVFLSGAVMGRILGPVEAGLGFVNERVMGSAKERALAKTERGRSITDLNTFFKDVGGHAGESIKKTVETYFNDPAHYAPEGVANLRVQNRAAQVMEEAIQNNDKYLYEHAKDGAFAKAVIAARKLNLLESLTDSLRAYGDHFNEEEFHEAYKVDFKEDGDRKSVKEYMNKLAGNVESFSKRFDMLREKFSDVVRPEKYVGEDHEKMKLIRRTLDDTIEWMAVSEYRAKRAGERGLAIIEDAAKLPSIRDSAYVLFRTLGDDKAVRGRLNILNEEIASLKSGSLEDAVVQRQLALKEQQQKALSKLGGNTALFEKDESETVSYQMQGNKVDFSKMDPTTVMDAIADYAGALNEELGTTTPLIPGDLEDVYFKLRDFRQLSDDEKRYMDVYAYLSNKKGFENSFIHIREGLENLQQKQIAAALGSDTAAAAANAAASAKNKKQAVTEQEVRNGKPVEEYHGYKVDDIVQDIANDDEYTILALTTTGIIWQDKADGKNHAISLDQFDKLVGSKQLVRLAAEQHFKVVFAEGEKKRSVDLGVDGVFIVEDTSRDDPFYTVTNADNQPLDKEGNLVPEGEEPQVYDSEDKAKEVRDAINEKKEKERERVATPYEFDGKEMRWGTVVVRMENGELGMENGKGTDEQGTDEQGTIEKGIGEGEEEKEKEKEKEREKGKKRKVRYRVVTRGKESKSEKESEQEAVEKVDRIELQPIENGGTDGVFSVDSMEGFELATEAAQRPEPKADIEGVFRLKDVNVLVQASGVPKEGEDQLIADLRLQALIRSVPPDKLGENLVIRIQRNENEADKTVAKEGTDDENVSLVVHDSPLLIELRYNNETVGTLPYFDQYSYSDENRQEFKMDELTLEQFEEVFDTRGLDAGVVYDAFLQYYAESKKLFNELNDRVRDSGHVDISAKELQAAFRVHANAGDTALVKEAQVPLKDLDYNGVNGKIVLLVQSLVRDDRNLSERTNFVLVEKGLPAEEQKKLEADIKAARERDGFDMAKGLGEYVAVVALPNGEFRFVPLDLNALSAAELETLAAQLNAQSAKTVTENWTKEGVDNPDYSGSYNGKFNADLLQQFFISAPGEHGEVYIDLSLNAAGEVLVNFQNAFTKENQTVLVGGKKEGEAVAFTSFADLLQKVNEAVSAHDQKAARDEKIGMQLKPEHFKKHLAKLGEKEPGESIDFDAVDNLPSFVEEHVVGPASLEITLKNNQADPMSVFLRKAAAASGEEVKSQNEKGKSEGGEEVKSGAGVVKKGKRAAKKGGRSTPENPSTGTSAQAVDPNKPKRSSLKAELEKLKAQEKLLKAKHTAILLEEANKKKKAAEDNGEKLEIDPKAIREAAESHPEVVEKTKRIAEIQAEKNKGNKGNAIHKVLTHKALKEADAEDIERFRNWMRDNLPDYVELEEVDLIAQNMGHYGVNVGKLVYYLKELEGRKLGAKIVTDRDAPFKYHEAFHTVFRLLLTNEQIDRFLYIARKEVTAKLRRENKTLENELIELRKLIAPYYEEMNKTLPSDAELEALYYEEHLADRFDAWKSDSTNEKDSWLNQLFRKIYAFIRRIIKNFTPGELETLFRDINAKKFKEARMANNRFTEDPELNVGPQVVLKSIKIGEKLIEDEDGEEMWVSEYLSEAKGTALASAIAGKYYERVVQSQELKIQNEKLKIQKEGKGKNNRTRNKEEGIGEGKEKEKGKEGVDEILEGVMDDYAKLYDKDNAQYLQLLLDEATIERYYNISGELDRLKLLLEKNRDVVREAVQGHMRMIRLMESEARADIEEVQDELGDRAMVDWHKNKESIGGFDSLSKWMRQYISTTTYVGKDAFGNTQLKDGEPLLQAVDATRVYTGILKMVAGIDDIHELLVRLQTIAQQNNHGYASEHSAHFIKRFFADMGLVVNEKGYELKNKDKAYLFNMVVKSFQQHAVDYLFFNKELNEKETKIIASNRDESKRKQFSIWYNAFSHLFLERYKRTSEARKPAMFKKATKGLEEMSRLMRLGVISDDGLPEKTVEISEQIREELGIHLHPMYIQYCLLETVDEDNLEPAQLDLLRRLPPVVPIGPVDIEILLSEIKEGKNPFVWNKDASDIEGGKMQERKESMHIARKLMDMAEANALFDESVNVTSFTNADRETVYGHQLPTFHLMRVRALSRELREGGPSGDPFQEGNFLRVSKDVQQMAGDIKVARVNGMNSFYSVEENEIARQEAIKRKGVTYGDFTEREMLLLLFELYGAGQGYKRSDGSWFRSSRHLIRVLEASNTGDTVNLPIFKAVQKDANGKVTLSDHTMNALVKEVRREFDRILRVKEEIKQIDKEKRTGKRVMKEIEGYHNGVKDKAPRGLTLFKTGGMLGALAKELEQEAAGDRPEFKDYEERLKLQLQAYWMGDKGQLDQTMEMLKELSIIQDKNGKLENVLLPNFMGTTRMAQDEGKRKQLELDKEDLRYNVAQVLLNDFLNTQSINQLLLGDQAESLESFVDMVKRAKGANGSGPSSYCEVTAPKMGIKHAHRTSHILHIDDPVFWGKYANGLQKKADAQMWMTLKALRYTMFGLGKLTPAQAVILDKLERGEAVDVDEVFGKGGTIALDGQTNPLKLLYYDGKRYIKISSFVLTPELTSVKRNGKWVARPNYRELHALREKLEAYEEKHQTTCMVTPVSGSKGEKANVARGVLPRMENGQMVDPISDWNFQELDNRYWRLQTENPSNKIEITDPTQAKTLILGEQDDSTEVWFPWSSNEKPITVGELKKIYLQQTAQRAKVKFRQARDQIFTIDEALQEIKTSADLKKVTPKLDVFLKKAVEVLRMSAADSQLLEFFSLDPQGRQRYDLNHPATLDKFTQLFLAYFTKGVMNEKVPGHAVTLVSNYGMKVIKRVLSVGDDGQPKRWEVITRRQYEQDPEAYEDALEWEGDLTRREYQTLAKKFTENGKRPTYIIDDLRHNVPEYGVDRKGREIITGYFSEYMTAPHSADVMREMDNFGGKIPDVIAKSFGVRIPSQDKHSFINLKLVDFLPAHYGSSGVFPAELTEISGADFDVDKLYISTKEHYRKVREDGMLEFLEYGKSKDEQTQFGEFVRYQKAHNRAFRKQYRSFLLANPDLPVLQAEIKALEAEWEAHQELLRADLAAFNEDYYASDDEAFAADSYDDDFYIEKEAERRALERAIGKPLPKKWRDAHKGLVDQIKAIQEEVAAQTLREFSMPDNVNAYAKKVKKEGEQNIGVLNNMLVDAKIQLLGNKHLIEAGKGKKGVVGGKTGVVGEDTNNGGKKPVADPLKDVSSTTAALKQVREHNPDAIDGIYGVQSFETLKGSIYRVLPNGSTQRYKTVTKHLDEPQSLIVFVKFKDPDQEQAFLRGIQDRERSNTKVYVTDKSGKIYTKNEAAIGNDVRLALFDSVKNEILDTVETSLVPKEGYNTYDERRYTVDGEGYRESHIGNRVIKINRAPTDELAQFYHEAKDKGTNPGLVKAIEKALSQQVEAYKEALSTPPDTTHQKGGRNPIAFEMASVQGLKDLVEDLIKDFGASKELMAILEEGNVDPDSFLGKVLAFRNNKEGAKNIGPAVNSMRACVLLNMFGVKLRDDTTYLDKKGNERKVNIWKFKLNGVEFNSYAHTRAYSHTITKKDGTKEHVFDGERIMHNISTIVSAMTDNAKERLAAKLGLNIEAVGLVSNLIAQGVPLRSAITLMLQPSVREYYKLTRNLKASVKTEEEEAQNKFAIGEHLLKTLAKGLSKEEMAVELTDDMMRDNILSNGNNQSHNYAVLNSFLKLRTQTQYFNDVSGVMKVVKGMQSTHEGDTTLEEKIDKLGLNDVDEVFNKKYIPFDLRQVLTGANESKPHDNVIAQYLKIFKEIRLLSKRVFIERSDTFQYMSNVIKSNFRVRWYDNDEFEKKLKRDLLSFLSIKAYQKLLYDAGRLQRAASLSPAMIFDGAADEMPDGFKDIVDVVAAIRKELPDNVFVANFLNVLPTHVDDGIRGYVPNPINRTGVNKAEVNTWAKLDALQTEKLQDSFMDILQNEETNKHAWALFHYLLVKDGGQFKNGSFIRYIPNAMFKDLLDATAKVNEVMMKGRQNGDFKGVFGKQDFELINEFVRGYMMNATNTKYMQEVNIRQRTEDLNFSKFTATTSSSEVNTDSLKKDELEELAKYVPKTFQVSEDGSEIVIDLNGGIREQEDKGYRTFDKLELAKYGKNTDSLKLRGFRMNSNVQYKKRKKEGEKQETGKRNGVEFPYVLKSKVLTEDGPVTMLYVLKEVEFNDKNNHKRRKENDPLWYFQQGSDTVAMGTHARYELVGEAEGHPSVWGGIFVFGDADVRAFPREREGMENGELRMENGEGMESLVRTPTTAGAAVFPLEDFMEEYGVDDVVVVDGAYVFYKDGELAENQEELERAFSMLSRVVERRAVRGEVRGEEPGDESDEPGAEDEDENFKELVKRMREGDLGCEGNLG